MKLVLAHGADHLTHLALKTAGAECYVHDCREINPPNVIVWRCKNEHRESFWYCSKHIRPMMSLALYPVMKEGPDGVLAVLPLCHSCHDEKRPVLEGVEY